MNRTGVTYDAYTPEEQLAIKQTVVKYARGEVQDIEVRLRFPLFPSFRL